MLRPKVSVFLGISLDGYIAGIGGDLSWLSVVETDPPEDTGYEVLMRDIDVMLLGRNTYDKALSFEAWPYHGKRVIVLTQRGLERRHDEEAYDGDLPALLASLAEQQHRHVYLDGGAAVRQGLQADVVDELTLSWVPTILGQGIPLFVAGLPTRRWRLKAARSFGSGLVQATYVALRG